MLHRVTEQAAGLLARRIVADAMARAWADPLAVLGAAPPPVPGDAIRAAWDVLRAECDGLTSMQLAPGELMPAEVDDKALLHWLSLPAARRAEAYRRTFGLVAAKTCPPYETEYLPWKDVTHQAQQLADIAGFYRAFGLRPDPSHPQRADHLALELEFSAYLLDKALLAMERGESEHVETCQRALAGFVSDHVAWWAPSFACLVCRRVGQLGESGDLALLGELGKLLRAWVAMERCLMALPAPTRLTRAAAGGGTRRLAPRARASDCTGVIVAGGLHTGAPHAAGYEMSMLECAADRLRPLCASVIGVAAPDQDVRNWPVDRVVREDAALPAGVLRGVAAGLEACGTVYAIVVSADMPLLSPALALCLRGAVSASVPVAVARWGGEVRPLPAVLAREQCRELRLLLQRGVDSLAAALDRLSHHVVREEECGEADRHGVSFQRTATLADFAALNALAVVEQATGDSESDGCGMTCTV